MYLHSSIIITKKSCYPCHIALYVSQESLNARTATHSSIPALDKSLYPGQDWGHILARTGVRRVIVIRHISNILYTILLLPILPYTSPCHITTCNKIYVCPCGNFVDTSANLLWYTTSLLKPYNAVSITSTTTCVVLITNSPCYYNPSSLCL